VWIILHRGDGFNQPGTVIPDKPGWLDVGFGIAQPAQHFGRTRYPVGVRRSQKNPQLIILLGNRLAAAVAPLGKYIGTGDKGVEVLDLSP